MTSLTIAIVSIVGYLLGAISFAVIVARSQGVDILKYGSGNPGATNVTRALGSKYGNIVFACDALKGAIAAGWPMFVFRRARSVRNMAISSLPVMRSKELLQLVGRCSFLGEI